MSDRRKPGAASRRRRRTAEPERLARHVGGAPLDVDEVVEEGDDVVVLIHIMGRGRQSGVTTDVRFYAQVKARDGKIAYIYDHEERKAALKAAGLRG